MKTFVITLVMFAIAGCRTQPTTMDEQTTTAPPQPVPQSRAMIVEVAIDYDGATGPQVKREVAGIVNPGLAALADVDRITTICKRGGYRGYIEAIRSDGDAWVEQIRDQVSEVDLPDAVTGPRVAIVDEVPKTRSSCAARVVVRLDTDRLRQFGLTAAQVNEHLNEARAAGLLQSDDTFMVDQLVVGRAGRRQIRLSDVADTYITCGAPDTIVTQLNLP